MVGSRKRVAIGSCAMVMQCEFESPVSSSIGPLTGARAISCPKCGGAVQTVAGQQYLQCDYCQSLVLNNSATVSLDRIVPTGQCIDTRCPACESMLQSGELEGRRALYCADCFGVLLRREDFSNIVRERASRRVASEPVEPQAISPAAYERHLKCPSCNSRMEVHPYYGPGNVVMDSCHACDFVWLDQGELTRIEHASGGYERQRTREPLPVGPAIAPESFESGPVDAAGMLFSLASIVFGR